MKFFRKYPCSYFFLEDFSLNICGETLRFPLPELVDVTKTQFGWESGVAHFAWLMLNCPELRKEVYSLRLSADGWWALVTLEEAIWTAVQEGWEEAQLFYKIIRKYKPAITQPALLFDRCEEEYNQARKSLTVEVDPVVSQFVVGLIGGAPSEPVDARVRRALPGGVRSPLPRTPSSLGGTRS